MDGWLVIKTRLDNTKFDSQIEKKEKELQKLSNEKVKIELEVEANTAQLDELSFKIDKLQNDRKILISGAIDDNDVKKIDQIDSYLADMNSKYDVLYVKSQSLAKNETDINKEYAKQSSKLDELKAKKQQLVLKNEQQQLKEISRGTSNVIKSVGRWALSIFSIRTAYGAITSAISILSSENQQLGADVDNIKYSLANALLPVIQQIVSWVYALFRAINSLSKALGGKEIFTDKNVSNLKGATTEATKLKKTLTGFDEMNVLSSQSTSGGGGSGGGGEMPSQSFSPSDEDIAKTTSFIEEIKKFWSEDVYVLMDSFTGDWDAFLEGLLLMTTGFVNGFWGVIDVIIGLGKMLIGVLTGDKELVEEGFNQLIEGLKKILQGILEFILGLLLTVFGFLKGILLEIFNSVVEIGAAVVNWLYEKIIKPIGEFFSNLWDGIKNGVKSAVDWVKDKFKSIIDFFSGLISKIVNLFKKIGTKVGDAISGTFKAIINGVLTAVENILNFPIKSINKLIGVINKVPGINLGTIPTFSLPRLAQGGIINLPGKGVPIGGYQAIGGESGQEGVIPLTDSQQMALLGEAIGKYITIDLTNITQLDGRTIARKTEQVSSNRNFAMNK